MRSGFLVWYGKAYHFRDMNKNDFGAHFICRIPVLIFDDFFVCYDQVIAGLIQKQGGLTLCDRLQHHPI